MVTLFVWNRLHLFFLLFVSFFEQSGSDMDDESDWGSDSTETSSSDDEAGGGQRVITADYFLKK